MNDKTDRELHEQGEFTSFMDARAYLESTQDVLLSRLVRALESGYAAELMEEDDGKCEICKNVIERNSLYIRVCVGILIDDTLCVKCGLTVLDRLEEHFDFIQSVTELGIEEEE